MLTKIVAVAAVITISQPSSAQFYKSILPSPEFNDALAKIVYDFRYNFRNITGDAVESVGGIDTYQSAVKLPGADNCVINKYHSAKDTTATWQGVLYDGNDYKEATKVYKNTFRLINKSRMQLVDKSLATFAGELQEPKEAVRFAESTLQLDTDDERYKRFTAQVELASTYSGWQVKVYFANKKPDADID